MRVGADPAMSDRVRALEEVVSRAWRVVGGVGVLGWGEEVRRWSRQVSIMRDCMEAVGRDQRGSWGTGQGGTERLGVRALTALRQSPLVCHVSQRQYVPAMNLISFGRYGVYGIHTC